MFATNKGAVLSVTFLNLKKKYSEVGIWSFRCHLGTVLRIVCTSFMFLFCLVFAMSLCATVYMCFVVTCWERADILALVCGVYCEFVTFPLVSWVRCGT